MESGEITTSSRHKCAACFKQYKQKEHLVAHMRNSHHSVHQPKCDVCQKHCKSFESLREHTIGRLAKGNCFKIFAERGCKLCMRTLGSSVFLNEHLQMCSLPAPAKLEELSLYYLCKTRAVGWPNNCWTPSSPAQNVKAKLLTAQKSNCYIEGSMKMPCEESQIYDPPLNVENGDGSHVEAVALDCEMVGGGSDGSLDICARVCLVDEDEKLIFHTYVLPQIPITDYRYEVTGITEEHLRDAIPLKEVREKILPILYNGESIGILRLNGGRARVLVGHSLEHDLNCLKMNYPDHLLRDTAKYPPLMKTNLVSHSLKYLVKTYLGYDIQSGMHDPYEDCVSAMRLFKRLRSQKHQTRGMDSPLASRTTLSLMNGHDSRKHKEIENMSPSELFEISKSNYRCWCLD